MSRVYARLARLLFRDRETRWWFACFGTLAYVLFLIWGHSLHELWRDEVHAWTLARLADGFGDIVTGDRVYDGHPPLWYWYLRVFSWVTDRVWGLRAATIFAMGCAALLFLRFAPFPRLLKLAILASYLLGYEYGVLSRNYSLGWLGVVAFCCAYHPLRPRLVWLTIVLGLIALTSVFGAILSCALFVSLLPVAIALGGNDETPAFVSLRVRKALLPSAAIMTAVLLFAVVTTIPPDPNPTARGWDFSALNWEGLRIVLQRTVHALLPVRAGDDVLYWGHHDHFWRDHETAASILGVAMIALILLALWPRWSLMAAFVIGFALISVFPLVRHGAFIRHIGHLYILAIGVLWIRRLWTPRGQRLSTALLMVIAAFQFGCLWVVTSLERKVVFSAGQATAQRIEQAGLSDMPVVAGPDWVAITVMGIIGRNFISSETEEINQTMTFHGRRRPYSPAGLIARAASEAQARQSAVLLLTDAPLTPAGNKVNLLFNEIGGNGESYWLYRVDP